MADGDDFNGWVIAKFRANGGADGANGGADGAKVGGLSTELPCCLLHHTGAKTGVARSR